MIAEAWWRSSQGTGERVPAVPRHPDSPSCSTLMQLEGTFATGTWPGASRSARSSSRSWANPSCETSSGACKSFGVPGAEPSGRRRNGTGSPGVRCGHPGATQPDAAVHFSPRCRIACTTSPLRRRSRSDHPTRDRRVDASRARTTDRSSGRGPSVVAEQQLPVLHAAADAGHR